ncbi:MAG TPA: hypothetical protein VM093_09880 [Aeromicrobium sp.]|nr:hypothetical protein [Aeromicrobium sp.]
MQLRAQAAQLRKEYYDHIKTVDAETGIEAQTARISLDASKAGLASAQKISQKLEEHISSMQVAQADDFARYQKVKDVDPVQAAEIKEDMDKRAASLDRSETDLAQNEDQVARLQGEVTARQTKLDESFREIDQTNATNDAVEQEIDNLEKLAEARVYQDRVQQAIQENSAEAERALAAGDTDRARELHAMVATDMANALEAEQRVAAVSFDPSVITAAGFEIPAPADVPEPAVEGAGDPQPASDESAGSAETGAAPTPSDAEDEDVDVVGMGATPAPDPDSGSDPGVDVGQAQIEDPDAGSDPGVDVGQAEIEDQDYSPPPFDPGEGAGQEYDDLGSDGDSTY